jgi:hypothetical protein
MTKEHFGGLRVNVSIILKQPAAELLWVRQWNYWSLKSTKFPDLLSDSQLLTKSSVPWSYIDIQTGSDAHTGSYPMGTGGSISPGLKRLRREADYSPESGTDVKNTWSYIFIPSYIFMSWCLIKPK